MESAQSSSSRSKVKTRWEQQKTRFSGNALVNAARKQRPRSKCRPQGIRNKMGEMGCLFEEGKWRWKKQRFGRGGVGVGDDGDG